MNHLEQLVAEWLEFKGYFIRRNVKVGRLPHGGHEGELDVVAYHPIENRLIHIETSTDAGTWLKREERFKKKFETGHKYIIPEILPWLPHNKTFEQWAVLWGSDRHHPTIGGGKVVPVRKLYRMIAEDIVALEKKGNRAVPEQFPLLRTMQYTLRYATPNRIEKEDAEPFARRRR